MHRRVSGTPEAARRALPAGTPYRASDPDLLLWVLYTLVDSAIWSCTASTWATMDRRGAGGAVGRLPGRRAAVRAAGIGHAGDAVATCERYGRDMLAGDELHVTDWARTRAREIVLEPPVPLAVRPVVEAVNFITIALLPERIRREYEFRPLPAGVGTARDRELAAPST